jgi:hypothetical protein
LPRSLPRGEESVPESIGHAAGVESPRGVVSDPLRRPRDYGPIDRAKIVAIANSTPDECRFGRIVEAAGQDRADLRIGEEGVRTDEESAVALRRDDSGECARTMRGFGAGCWEGSGGRAAAAGNGDRYDGCAEP